MEAAGGEKVSHCRSALKLTVALRLRLASSSFRAFALLGHAKPTDECPLSTQVIWIATRIAPMYKAAGSMMVVALTCSFSLSVRAQQATAAPVAAETLQSMLAAQIRMQGFSCDRPLTAVSNTKRSRPDRGVWVLKCSNATYQITRAPDMAATVKQLP